MYTNDRSGLRRLHASQTIHHQHLQAPRRMPTVIWTSPLARGLDWLRRTLLRR